MQGRVPKHVPLQVSTSLVLQVSRTLLQRLLLDDQYRVHLDATRLGLGPLRVAPKTSTSNEDFQKCFKKTGGGQGTERKGPIYSMILKPEKKPECEKKATQGNATQTKVLLLKKSSTHPQYT